MEKKFEGTLSTPIEPRLPKLQAAALRGDSEVQKLFQKCAQEDLSKLLLLCRYYDISEGPHMFYSLSLALARDFVNGFKERKPPGRKLKWTVLNKGALVVEIKRIARPDNQTYGVAWAATQLAKREPWKSFLQIKESGKTCPDPAEALRKTYYSFEGNRWAKLMWDAFKMHEYEGTIAAWEELVADSVKNPDPE
jgi:hypothetical protein